MMRRFLTFYHLGIVLAFHYITGNWSVDSACHSMHSDQVTVLLPPGDGIGRQARRSLDKDSAISDVHQSDRFVFAGCSLCVYVCMYVCVCQRWVRLARTANRLELELAPEIC